MYQCNGINITSQKCATLWPCNIPRKYSLHLVIFILVVSVWTIACNSVVIYCLYKTKQITANINKFVLLMSISDLMNGITVMPSFAIAIAMGQKSRNCMLEKVTLFGMHMFGYFSFFLLICISRDRYYQIRRLRVSGSSLTRLQTRLHVAASFLASQICAWLGITVQSFTFQIVICIINIILLSAMFIIYTLLLRRIRGYQRRVASSITSTPTGPQRFDKSVAKTIWMLFFALFLSYIPFNITTPMFSYFVNKIGTQPGTALQVIIMWSYLLASSYSGVNAMILAFGNGAIRRFIKRRIREITSSKRQYCTTQVVCISRKAETRNHRQGISRIVQ